VGDGTAHHLIICAIQTPGLCSRRACSPCPRPPRPRRAYDVQSSAREDLASARRKAYKFTSPIALFPPITRNGTHTGAKQAIFKTPLKFPAVRDATTFSPTSATRFLNCTSGSGDT
jgi:hypothetical protein